MKICPIISASGKITECQNNCAWYKVINVKPICAIANISDKLNKLEPIEDEIKAIAYHVKDIANQ